MHATGNKLLKSMDYIYKCVLKSPREVLETFLEMFEGEQGEGSKSYIGGHFCTHPNSADRQLSCARIWKVDLMMMIDACR